MKRWCIGVLAAMLTACSSGTHGSAGAPAGDPIAFPLFNGANVLSAHHWQRTITAQPGVGDHAVFAQGAGTYDGHDVVAGTQAFMPALEAWLGDLSAHPPDGYAVAVTGNGIDSVRTHTRELGLDFQAFSNTESGKRHGVVVMVVDPQVLNDKAGSMLQLIGRLKYAPENYPRSARCANQAADRILAERRHQSGYARRRRSRRPQRVTRLWRPRNRADRRR